MGRVRAGLCDGCVCGAMRRETQLEFESIRRDIKESENKTALEFESIRRDIKESENRTALSIKESENRTALSIKESENKTALELEAMRGDIKALDSKTTLQSELLRRDLKIWLGGMLITLVAVFSAIVTLIPHLTNH